MSAFTDIVLKTAKELLSLLEIKAEDVSAEEKDGVVELHITVAEGDSGILIGYHGETLGALQYLIGQIANKGKEAWTRIQLNINQYRDQREVQLKQMAQNAADRALSTGDEIEMPYLTPAERRIIHLELSTRTDVSSFSEGEGRNRRLIITPKKST